METKSIRINIKKHTLSLNSQKENIRTILQNKVLSAIYPNLELILNDKLNSLKFRTTKLIILEVNHFLQIYLSHLIKEKIEEKEFPIEIEFLVKIIFKLYPKLINKYRTYTKQILFGECINYLLKNKSNLISEDVIQSFFENEQIYKEEKVDVIEIFFTKENVNYFNRNTSILNIILNYIFKLFSIERNLTLRIKLLSILFSSFRNKSKQITKQIATYLTNKIDIINLFASAISDKTQCNEYLEYYICQLLTSEFLLDNNNFTAMIELIKNNDIQISNENSKTLIYSIKKVEGKDKDKKKLIKNFLILIKPILKSKVFCERYLNKMKNLFMEFDHKSPFPKKGYLQLCLNFFVYIHKYKLKFNLQKQTQELIIKIFLKIILIFALNQNDKDILILIFELFDIGEEGNNSEYDIQLICNQIIEEMKEDPIKEEYLTKLIHSICVSFENKRFIYDFINKYSLNILVQNFDNLLNYLQTKESYLFEQKLDLEENKCKILNEIINFLKFKFQLIILFNHAKNVSNLLFWLSKLISKLIEFIKDNNAFIRNEELMKNILMIFELVFKPMIINKLGIIKLHKSNIMTIANYLPIILSFLDVFKQEKQNKLLYINCGKRIMTLICVYFDNLPYIQNPIIDFKKILELVQTFIDLYDDNDIIDFVCLDNICKILFNVFSYIEDSNESLIQEIFLEKKYYFKLLNIIIQNKSTLNTNNNKQFVNIRQFISIFLLKIINFLEKFLKKPYSEKDLCQLLSIFNIIPCSSNNNLNQQILNCIILFYIKLLQTQNACQKKKFNFLLLFNLQRIDLIKNIIKIIKFYITKISSSNENNCVSKEINIKLHNSLLQLLNEVLFLYPIQKYSFEEKKYSFIYFEILDIIEYIFKTIDLTKEKFLFKECLQIITNVKNNKNDTFDKKEVFFANILWLDKQYQRLLEKVTDIFFKSNMDFQTERFMKQFFMWLYVIIQSSFENINGNKWLRASILKNRFLDLPKISYNTLHNSINQLIDFLGEIEKKEISYNIKQEKLINIEEESFDILQNNIYPNFTIYVNEILMNDNDDSSKNYLKEINNLEDKQLNILTKLTNYLETEKNIKNHRLEYVNLLLSSLLDQFLEQYPQKYNKNIIENFVNLLNLDDTICYKHTKYGLLLIISHIAMTQNYKDLKNNTKFIDCIKDYIQKFLRFNNHKEIILSNYEIKLIDCICLCLNAFSQEENFVNDENIYKQEFIIDIILYEYKKFSSKTIFNCLEICVKLIKFDINWVKTIKDDFFKMLFTKFNQSFLDGSVIMTQIFQIILLFDQDSEEHTNIRDYFFNNCYFQLFIINVLKKSAEDLQKQRDENIIENKNIQKYFEKLFDIIVFYLGKYQQIFIDACIIESKDNIFKIFNLLDINIYENIFEIIVLFKEYNNIIEISFQQIIEFFSRLLENQKTGKNINTIFDYINFLYSEGYKQIIYNDLNLLKNIYSFLENEDSDKNYHALLIFRHIFESDLDNINPQFSFEELNEKLCNCFKRNYSNEKISFLIIKIYSLIYDKLPNNVLNDNLKMFLNFNSLVKIKESNNKCTYMEIILEHINLYLEKTIKVSNLIFHDIMTMLKQIFTFNEWINVQVENNLIKILKYMLSFKNLNSYTKEVQAPIASFIKNFNSYSYYKSNSNSNIIQALKPFLKMIEEIDASDFVSLFINLFHKQDLHDNNQDELFTNLLPSLKNILDFAKICFIKNKKEENNQLMFKTFDTFLNSILTLYDHNHLIQDPQTMNCICDELIKIIEAICLNNATFLEYLSDKNPKLSEDRQNFSFDTDEIEQNSLIIVNEKKYSICPYLSHFHGKNSKNSPKRNFVEKIHKKMKNLLENKFRLLILDYEEKNNLLNYFKEKINVYFYEEKGLKHKGILLFHKHSHSLYQAIFITNKDVPMFYFAINWIIHISKGIESVAFDRCNKTWFNTIGNPENCFVIFLESKLFDYYVEQALSFEVAEQENSQTIFNTFINNMNLLLTGISPFPRKKYIK